MVRSVNVKKTKSSKKIVLKITMSMTSTCMGSRPGGRVRQGHETSSFYAHVLMGSAC